MQIFSRLYKLLTVLLRYSIFARYNRRLLETTEMLLKDMARAAKMG
jgi:hypothetical protein